MTTMAGPTRSEQVEAKVRRKMAQVASLPRRGWDTGRERDREMDELDALLDEWNALIRG